MKTKYQTTLKVEFDADTWDEADLAEIKLLNLIRSKAALKNISVSFFMTEKIMKRDTVYDTN